VKTGIPFFTYQMVIKTPANIPAYKEAKAGSLNGCILIQVIVNCGKEDLEKDLSRKKFRVVGRPTHHNKLRKHRQNDI
jgi:hypothetical protein